MNTLCMTAFLLINLQVFDVENGIEWQGLIAKDKFYVTYHGDVLSKSMEEVTCSSLMTQGFILDHGLNFSLIC